MPSELEDDNEELNLDDEPPAGGVEGRSWLDDFTSSPFAPGVPMSRLGPEEEVWSPFQHYLPEDLPDIETGPPVESREDYEDLLDEWGERMDAGDYAGVLTMLERRLAHIPGLPPLQDVIAGLDSDADEEKRRRREAEEALRAMYAARLVRRVDPWGRSYGTGKRKCSIARVWIREGPGTAFSINRTPMDAYFGVLLNRAWVLEPFRVTGTLGSFSVTATVRGGGTTGQAQAVRHGLARALQKWDPGHHSALKAAGLLTRDSRIVERKKPGRAKARKGFQWVKR